MKALVIGATGATGKELVNLLLESTDYSEVSIFVRRSTGKSHSKLIEHIVDFSDVNSFRELITGNVLFSCIGTTLKDAGSKEKQWKIDYDIPAEFASAAKQCKFVGVGFFLRRFSKKQRILFYDERETRRLSTRASFFSVYYFQAWAFNSRKYRSFGRKDFYQSHKIL
jgi:hypothetical protein